MFWDVTNLSGCQRLFADGILAEKVDWEVRFRGSGRQDRRIGDAATALERMHQAALAPDFILKISAKQSVGTRA